MNELISQYSSEACKCDRIDSELYSKYEVKRGLRDISGKGVVAGLTEISEVSSYIIDEGDLIPCEGKLYYRGYDVEDLVNNLEKEERFGFEEVCYLLLFGHLPTVKEYISFRALIGSNRSLPEGFVRDNILNSVSKDMMNSMARSVLTLYGFDDKADDISIGNIIRQSVQLIARFPSLMVYGYQGYSYKYLGESLVLHSPKPELSTAENILYMLRPDSKYTNLEARILDIALVLHAEHGGGNNSTFTNHVVTSSGTDSYSAVAASLASLKGPKHGGANIKVCKMFENIQENVKDWDDEDEIRSYVGKIVDKEAFDKSGLVYGIGHAVYSLSDPRAVLFKGYVQKLAEIKGYSKEFKLHEKVEKIAPEVISKKRRMYKGVSANVDFYSGFVYQMLNLPEEIYTPLFAVARIAGWSAHRVEEISNGGKIIRPAYKAVRQRREFVPIAQR
ncbi:MAG: citrate synthase [Treponema sp. CETP13]|nr:MAG: citrate synthase [Treponema sp. CETP13]